MGSGTFRLLTAGVVVAGLAVVGYHSARASSKAEPGAALAVRIPPELLGGAIDFTFADIDGNAFCDGITLTIDGTDLSLSGTQTGCLTGPAYGSINDSLFPSGIGGGIAYSGDFVGLYTQVTFNPPFWIHYDQGGNIVNFGALLFQPPAESGAGVASADVTGHRSAR